MNSQFDMVLLTIFFNQIQGFHFGFGDEGFNAHFSAKLEYLPAGLLISRDIVYIIAHQRNAGRKKLLPNSNKILLAQGIIKITPYLITNLLHIQPPEVQKSKRSCLINSLEECIILKTVSCESQSPFHFLLDFNGRRYFGLPERLDRATAGLMKRLEKNCNFDPFVGVKLYSFLYDLGFKDIDVNLSPHNLIFGKLKENQKFNWVKKRI